VCARAAISRFCAREVINLELTPASVAESTSIENRVEDGIEATGILSVSGKKVATGRIEHTIPFLFGVETTGPSTILARPHSFFVFAISLGLGLRVLAELFDVSFCLLCCLISVFANLGNTLILTRWFNIDDKAGSI
jgi:hypothetical protein